MQYRVFQKKEDLYQLDCVVIPVFKTAHLSIIGQDLNQKSKGQIERFVQDNLTDKLGRAAVLYEPNFLPIKNILCIYCGNQAMLSLKAFEQLMHQIIVSIDQKSIRSVGIDMEGFLIESQTVHTGVTLAIQSLEAMLYRFDIFKTKKESKANFECIAFYYKDDLQVANDAMAQGIAIAQGMTVAKNLSNLPANHGTPRKIVEQICKLSKALSNITIQVLDETDNTVKKMGAFLGVAQGSSEPPQFVVMHYQPCNPITSAPIVLIGKGITFDTGGISIKPAHAMGEMKFDMAGAASVVGTLHAVATLQLKIPIIGILPFAENLINGSALKPGDVLTTLSGQTVEVENTDAEGRLILADALTYSHQFNPSTIIDIATLTGSVVVALGEKVSGLMTNNQALENELVQASQNSGDLTWPLPLWENYQEMINSNIADFSNLGEKGAGSITAACFLSRFVEKKIPWAHLDIAGVAYQPGRQKAATGRPVPLLMQYLLQKQRQHLSSESQESIHE